MEHDEVVAIPRRVKSRFLPNGGLVACRNLRQTQGGCDRACRNQRQTWGSYDRAFRNLRQTQGGCG